MSAWWPATVRGVGACAGSPGSERAHCKPCAGPRARRARAVFGTVRARGDGGVRTREGGTSGVGGAEAHRSRRRPHRRARFRARRRPLGRRAPRPGRGTATPGGAGSRGPEPARLAARGAGRRRPRRAAEPPGSRAPGPGRARGRSPERARPRRWRSGPEGGWEASEVAGQPSGGTGSPRAAGRDGGRGRRPALCALREGVVGPSPVPGRPRIEPRAPRDRSRGCLGPPPAAPPGLPASPCGSIPPCRANPRRKRSRPPRSRTGSCNHHAE